MGEPTHGTNVREFRRQLDDVLRRRSPTALRDFLIAAGQWDAENVPADLDRAMWMMIAASPVLSDLHGEAQRWLVDHGFGQEAQAIVGRGGSGRRRPAGAAHPGSPGNQRARPRQPGPQQPHKQQSERRDNPGPNANRPTNAHPNGKPGTPKTPHRPDSKHL